MIKSNFGDTDEQWAEKVSQMTGHPDTTDMDDARRFVRKVLGK